MVCAAGQLLRTELHVCARLRGCQPEICFFADDRSERTHRAKNIAGATIDEVCSVPRHVSASLPASSRSHQDRATVSLYGTPVHSNKYKANRPNLAARTAANVCYIQHSQPPTAPGSFGRDVSSRRDVFKRSSSLYPSSDTHIHRCSETMSESTCTLCRQSIERGRTTGLSNRNGTAER